MSEPSQETGKRVAGRTALVCGAASGIGRATAMALAGEGAAVACADVDVRGAEETAAAIASRGGSAWACRLDVSSEPDWERAIEQVIERRGGLDILVNSAGIAAASPVDETALEDWRRVLAVNLDGVFLGTKHALRAMRRGSREGSIVNVSSVSGIKPQPDAGAYCASKAAVIQFTRTAALECLRRGDRIRVNCISPGGVKTPMWRTMPFFRELMQKEGSEEAAFEAMARSAPWGRFALPEEVAGAILYLASGESSFVNGTNLVFDSGD